MKLKLNTKIYIRNLTNQHDLYEYRDVYNNIHYHPRSREITITFIGNLSDNEIQKIYNFGIYKQTEIPATLEFDIPGMPPNELELYKENTKLKEKLAIIEKEQKKLKKKLDNVKNALK